MSPADILENARSASGKFGGVAGVLQGVICETNGFLRLRGTFIRPADTSAEYRCLFTFLVDRVYDYLGRDLERMTVDARKHRFFVLRIDTYNQPFSRAPR